MKRRDLCVQLIQSLLSERPELCLEIPSAPQDQKQLLRGLMNVRPPLPASPELLQLQDAWLQQELRYKQIISSEALAEMEPGICLWQGDMTCLRADAIVNAANEYLLGCFLPGHGCIDNALHSAAGIQLRQACHQLMEAQGHPEEVGKAKVTPGFNLPARWVIHTVGPHIRGILTPSDCQKLSSCYRSCLEAAQSLNCHSLAFCCISTGEYHFPAAAAAAIAVETVRQFLTEQTCELEVIFNVYKDSDLALYRRLLG